MEPLIIIAMRGSLAKLESLAKEEPPEWMSRDMAEGKRQGLVVAIAELKALLEAVKACTEPR